MIHKIQLSRTKFWALVIVALIMLLLLPGCVQPGIRIYEPVAAVTSDGHKHEKTALVAAIHADLAGVQKIESKSVSIVFLPSSGAMVRTPILNKDKSAVIGYAEAPVVAGVNVSEPTKAWGDAFSKSVRSLSSFIGTAFAGFAGVAAAQGAAGAAASAASAITP